MWGLNERPKDRAAPQREARSHRGRARAHAAIDAGGQRGSMLLELMFAAVIALVVVGAAVSALARQGSHQRVNLETTLVTNAIADVFARLRTVPIGSLHTFDGIGFPVADHLGRPNGLAAVPGDLDGLPGHIAVSTALSSGSAVLYRVEVSVDWLCAGTRRHESIVGEMGERK
ncbi:MAG: hypothetical protein R3F56_06840 [Planctomycetota bacterium]